MVQNTQVSYKPNPNPQPNPSGIYYLTSDNQRCTLGEIAAANNASNDLYDTNHVNGWGHAIRALVHGADTYINSREKRIRWGM